MYSLLLLSSLLHITTCTVYTVTPDDHYYPNTTCHHCHNLQHYLLNITKYFTSNTQLLFLPGLHHLHTHLIIQNVHNISLIGSTANGTTLDTVIQCNSSVGILMNNITNLNVRNVTIKGCKKFYGPLHDQGHAALAQVAVTIKNCFNVILSCLNICIKYDDDVEWEYPLSLLGINVFGKLEYISCNAIFLYYHEMQMRNISNTILIDHFQQVQWNNPLYAIKLEAYQYSYDVTIKLAHIRYQQQSTKFLYGYLSDSILYVVDCDFLSNEINKHNDFHIISIEDDDHNSMTYFINCNFLNNAYTFPIIEIQSDVKIVNCTFIENLGSDILVQPESALIKPVKIIIVIENTRFCNNTLFNANSVIDTWYADVTLVDCIFDRNLNLALRLSGYECAIRGRIVIKNTHFLNSVMGDYNNLLIISHSHLLLEELVTFHATIKHDKIIKLNSCSTITIHGIIKFSSNIGYQLIELENHASLYIKLMDPSIVSMHHNYVCNFIIISICNRIFYPFCMFQYYTDRTLEEANFSIKYYNNHYNSNISECHSVFYDCNIPTVNCHWLPESAFYNMMPLIVKNQFIKYFNNSNAINRNYNDDYNTLCACNKQMVRDCSINDLGYLYPGETLATFLYYKDNKASQQVTEIIEKNDINTRDSRPCIVPSFVEQSQMVINNYCSKVSYSTITFRFGDWCELFLKVELSSDDYHKRFYIRKLICPPGFLEIDKICQCDPVIVNFGITQCNINNQTVLRPSNTWITATTYTPYSYHISKQCRFYYCLPHSSHLNFSTPNSQCYFNRSGLLCGHCHQGLSTVFSSSRCHHCSNVYLFLIIPIAIAGIALVIILFILNITVTDGTINGFILLGNIISINTSLVFPRLEDFTPTYTFISFANLDLGIRTCFYNGMDDYAKMWLQLAFPFYLIFIATLIIITSRYSIKIQRLTARRALPVLATLFLLSYTKVLRIVSSVLFFYSTITHLPSEHTTLVWSVDANVPLFGVRFIILFIVCLMLFLILVPFNAILLFTRTLSRFQCINRFKPILDAYQGPYKDRYYYWTGLQLVVRAALFVISSLDRNNNLTTCAIIFGILGGIHGVLRPLRSKIQNYQELLFMFYLQGLYIIALNAKDTTDMTAINTIIILVMVQFCLIIIYHIITYVCGVRDLSNKMMTNVDTLAKWITRSFSKPRNQQFELHNNIRNSIPDVAFNYREFREPLIGQD